MQLEIRVSQSYACLKFILALAFAKLQRSKAPLEKNVGSSLACKNAFCLNVKAFSHFLCLTLAELVYLLFFL